MQVRWLIKRDMDEVLTIDDDSFADPWTVSQFYQYLRQRNCIGCVVERDRKVIGFMLYELHESSLRIINLAVAPNERSRGAGRAMIQRLINKLSRQKRRSIEYEIRETNLLGQLFLSACGFRAVDILRDNYEDGDGYVMRYELEAELSDRHNRISHLFGNA